MRILIWLGILGLAGSSGMVIVWQRQDAHRLQREIGQLRTKVSELPALEEEHRRLLATQVSPANRERLRADHAALEQLRAQLAAIKAQRAAP